MNGRRLPFPGWVAGVFALAFAARLGFLLAVDQPLLYTHPYNYFSNALAISQHADPWDYVLRHDDWRMQYGEWTVAPLYTSSRRPPSPAGREASRFTLRRALQPYTARATRRPGAAIVVELDSPTWCRLGEPADQGVRVDSMTVAPAATP